MAKYDQDFFLRTYNVNRRSAEIVLSTLFEVADIRSAVDVGCGLGTWLEAAQQLGVDSILGIDGHWLQDEVELKIDRDQVIFQNLGNYVAKSAGAVATPSAASTAD